MRAFAAAGSALLLFLLTGGIWVGLSSFIPSDIPYTRSTLTIVFGLAFSGVFLWLLISRVQSLLRSEGNLWIEAGMALANLSLLLLAYAMVYTNVGITDTNGPEPTITRDFGICLYYSVITFTTIGYGDLLPLHPVARTMAAIQGLVGYLVLGLLASTLGSVLQQERKRKQNDD